LALTRRARASAWSKWAASWASALAVLISFAAMGMYHDVYTWAAQHRFTLGRTAFFVANACVLIAWVAAGRAWDARVGRESRSTPPGWVWAPMRRLAALSALALLIGAFTLAGAESSAAAPTSGGAASSNGALAERSR